MNSELNFICKDTIIEEEFLQFFLEAAAPRKQYRQGVYLLRQSDAPDKLHLMLDGVVKSSTLDSSGNHNTILLHTGKNLLGISGMDGQESEVSFRCMTDVTVATVDMGTVMTWSGEMLLPIATCQTRIMQTIFRQLRDRSFLSTEQQMVKLLEDLDASGILHKLGQVRRQLLADILGLSRVQVSAVLKKLNQQGRLPERWLEALGGGNVN